MITRRRFILSGLAVSAVAGSGALWLSVEKHDKPLTIDWALIHLQELKDQQLSQLGAWSLNQTLVHCAQSVEYSMTGFPEHRSEFFKSTIGKAAFSAFSAKGKMTHNLAEPIPGAPSLDVAADGFTRFRQSMLNFQAFTGKLAPHFAYGELTKAEYELAHVMHFNNHLIEFT